MVYYSRHGIPYIIFKTFTLIFYVKRQYKYKSTFCTFLRATNRNLWLKVARVYKHTKYTYADEHNVLIVPVQSRFSPLTGYPVDWRVSVLLAPRYPVDRRDSGPSGPPGTLGTGRTQSFRPPGTLRTGGTVLLAPRYRVDWQGSSPFSA